MLEGISLVTLSRSRWEGGSAHIAWSSAVPSLLQLLLLSAAEGCGMVYLWVSVLIRGGSFLPLSGGYLGAVKLELSYVQSQDP